MGHCGFFYLPTLGIFFLTTWIVCFDFVFEWSSDVAFLPLCSVCLRGDRLTVRMCEVIENANAT